MDEYRGYSIEGIASEVGYQSRSTFYREFRQVTGMTPKEYIEGYREIGSVQPS
jgi:AraC-like DNA-binding protein